MKVIIAGSRTVTDLAIIETAIRKADFPITEVVSGGARGVDTLGEEYAKKNGIPIKRFPANWDKYGKSAGYKRNVQMAEYADALIAVWDGESRGTMHMINIARDLGIKNFIYFLK